MKQPHLQGGALLAACAAGRGAIVIVEGEHREDDEYFYSRWFGTLGPRISFFAQNGWEQVRTAVTELRSQLPNRPVHGIVDRDFGDHALLDAQAGSVPPDGIWRLPRYTLENYLLEPEGWHTVALTLTRNNLPTGWASSTELAAHIDAAYRECLPLAAFNHTIHDEYRRSPTDGLAYREHPAALEAIDPAGELAAWGARRSTPRPLDEVYREHLARLHAATPAEWSAEVTGKAVLRVFLRELVRTIRRQVSSEMLCSIYLNTFPEPHDELVTIVESILVAAGT